MSIIYLTLDQAIDVHRKTVEVSGGGAMGHLDIGKLESVLSHIRNDDYYPAFADKLTHFFSMPANSTAFKTAINVSLLRYAPRCCFLTAISTVQGIFYAKWKISVITLRREK